MHHEIGVSDRRSFLRYVGQLALTGLGVGMLARPAFASSESEQLACTCCVNCQACNCSTCPPNTAKYRCTRAGCALCTSCQTAGGCYSIGNCC